MNMKEEKLKAGLYKIHFPDSGNSYTVSRTHGGASSWDIDWKYREKNENGEPVNTRFLIREGTKKECKSLVQEWEKALSDDYDVEKSDVRQKFNVDHSRLVNPPSPFKTDEHEEKVKDILRKPGLAQDLSRYYTCTSQELQQEFNKVLNNFDPHDWNSCFDEYVDKDPEVVKVKPDDPVPEKYVGKWKFEYLSPIPSFIVVVVCEDKEGEEILTIASYVGD